ncbi:MAG: hypothetical protein MJ191_07220 [Clostridium sp.]|nr:hypothetical protein [Clostridium sp.]
MKLKSSVVKKI